MRRLHRWIITALALFVSGVLALSGCSGGTESGGSSDEPVKLTYALWNKDQQPVMEQIIKAYTAEHPNVTIETQLTPYDKYWTKLQTSMSGGSGPDVFWMNGPNFQLYAANDQLAPLDVDTANYPKALVDLYTFDGKTYGAPKDFDTIGVWYNKSLFKAAGVEPPKQGWTWDDYDATAKALTDKKAGVWGAAAPLTDQTGYYNTIYQAGGYVISPDGKQSGYGSPEALAGIDFWVDQIKAGTSPTLSQMTDTAAQDMFTSGKVGMYWSGSWSAIAFNKNKSIAKDLDVVPLPAGKAGNQSVIHGLANVANAKSKHLDAAKEFALFASGKQAADIQAETGAVIPAYNDTQQAWVDSMPDYDLKVFIDAVATAVPYPVSKNTAAWASLQDPTLSQVWALSLPAEEGLQTLAKQMQAQLDKENK